MDRTLYVWACSKGSCQKKDGRYVGASFSMSIVDEVIFLG